MATNNAKYDESGSDMWSERMCDKCEGSTIRYAEHFCVDCDHNLCSVCYIQHNKFLKNHKLTDKLQAPTRSTQRKPEPTQRCSKHGERVVVYCENHDAPCCNTCVSVDHGECAGKIKFIPDIATDFKNSEEVKGLEKKVKDLQTQLQTQKKNKETNLQQLKKDKDALLNEIRALKKKLNQQLDKMEKDLLNDADAMFKVKVTRVSDYIAEIDKSLAQITRRLQLIQDAKRDNESELFVECKFWKHELAKDSSELDPLPFERSFKLNTFSGIKAIEEGKQRLAELQENTVIKSTSEYKDAYIRVTNDKMPGDITAMCAMSNEYLVLADYNNKRLKKLHLESFKASKLIDLPDNPFGVCTVDNNRLAVTLINQKKVKLVSLGNTVTVDSGFSVVDRCRGVAYADGLLYVCCGGSPHRIDEGHGCVQVYSLDGELYKCFYKDIVCPSVIAVSNDALDPWMLISDEDKGIQLRSLSGDVIHSYATGRECNLPFCMLENEHVCVGESSSGKIYLLSRENQNSGRRLLAHTDEMQALYFDKRRSLLFVAFGANNEVKALSLNQEN